MAEFDSFAQSLLEEAKRFLEKAEIERTPEGRAAYLHAALMLAFGGLEAHVNSISSDFLVRNDLSVLDRALLSERDIQLRRGKFEVTDRLKINRLEDRIQFLHHRFSGLELDTNSSWWSKFKAGLDLRNQMTHPKDLVSISADAVSDAMQAIIDTLDALYRGVYKSPYPAGRRSLKSTLSF
jgi:hypothetical protein